MLFELQDLLLSLLVLMHIYSFLCLFYINNILYLIIYEIHFILYVI